MYLVPCSKAWTLRRADEVPPAKTTWKAGCLEGRFDDLLVTGSLDMAYYPDGIAPPVAYALHYINAKARGIPAILRSMTMTNWETRPPML